VCSSDLEDLLVLSEARNRHRLFLRVFDSDLLAIASPVASGLGVEVQ